jgi:hypothetical protein
MVGFRLTRVPLPITQECLARQPWTGSKPRVIKASNYNCSNDDFNHILGDNFLSETRQQASYNQRRRKGSGGLPHDRFTSYQ